MASALSPREIQQRIRRGASVEEVVSAAGVPADQLTGFIRPALAERGYYTKQALAAPVRRRGQSIAHRTLETAVTDRLASRSIELDNLEWDAWQLERGTWRVIAKFDVEDSSRTAEFTYNQAGRFSVASNHEARWLLGENASSEATPHTEGEPTVTLASSIEEEILEPTVAVTEADLYDAEDAFSEAELTEVDGVYDLQPSNTDSDVLRDILSTINEDSVKIYTDLIQGDDTPETPARKKKTAEPKPATKKPAAKTPEPSKDKDEQPALLDGPARPPRRRQRASVPTWDEIMFGGSKS